MMKRVKIKNKLFFLLTILAGLSIFELSGCSIGGRLYNTENACAIFAQRNGFFNNWYKQSKAASLRYKIPIPILLATIKTESSFRPTARTRWHMVLGFIPWGRISTAYGYAQALNGTWVQYKKSTGHHYASRSSFSDSIDFVAWYYRNAIIRDHINPNDAYNLYICYVIGWKAFKDRGALAATPAIRSKAREVALLAQRYHLQLRNCIERR